MTSINRLNQVDKVEDNDLIPLWQSSSGRTRATEIKNIREFIQSTDPNADAFVKADLVGDDIVLTSYDETETKIDINILPEHSVTELKDMPKNLLSGQYLKVNDAGTGFVLTPSTDSAYDGDGFGVPQYEWTESGVVVQTEITKYYKNNSTDAGDLNINCRTDDGVKNWRFYYWLPKSSLPSRNLYVTVDEKAGENKTVRSGEVWQCEVKAGQLSDTFFWTRVDDGTNTFITPEETALLIESNNDEIITPNQGTQFQLIDADKSSGYGDNGSITYYGPDYSGSQSTKLINNLSNSKSYFVHRETSSQHGFAMLHESYVSQIYNQDVTGVLELTMLFGPDSRGRYAKSNQVTPAGTFLNWNGDYIPDTEDPNDLNPSSWIDLAGNATQVWSSTGIKNACYSGGLLVNDGSALLKRGDVFCHDNAGVKTSTFTANSDSEFFVMPIKVGGGTLSDLKLLPLFMSRLHTTQNEWDSYTFDNAADCVGAILKISYDSAIESAGDIEKLVAAIAENNLYQADLQTRFGVGTVEVNNLEFTVDSITSNNINGDQ